MKDRLPGRGSERLVGELMGAERDRFVRATKYTLSRRQVTFSARVSKCGTGNPRLLL